MELDKNWRFREKGEGEWLPAVVPGSVHTDLLTNKKIPDPFYRVNETLVQWVEERDWEYAVTFSIEEAMLEKRNMRLIFHGLDTYARVTLNDNLLLRADNMFREWVVDVKSHLKKGENRLHILFSSPVKRVAGPWGRLGYKLPGGPRVMTRKAAYHYGWDWGPRLVTSGIWRGVELQAWDSAGIETLHLVQETVSKESAVVTAHFEIHSDAEQEAVVSLSMEAGDGEQPLNRAGVHLVRGINRVSFSFHIENPELWWTNGLGKPHLYGLRGRLKIGGRVVDGVSERMGLRTIEVVVKKDKGKEGQRGESFYFKLN
ncbi:MAG: glycoside hydrolase family 2 protein, partial [bacterium]|nr:glycoside hydrolase family 2 protein [bacterium]